MARVEGSLIPAPRRRLRTDIPSSTPRMTLGPTAGASRQRCRCSPVPHRSATLYGMRSQPLIWSEETVASGLLQLTRKLESGLPSLITHVHLSKATNLQPEFCQQHKLSIKPQIEAVKVQLKAIARAAKRLGGHR
jgi:hypothetical protein